MSEHVLSPQSALVYLMVLVSAADSDMTDEELRTIGDVVRIRPVFENYPQENLLLDANACAQRLGSDDGLDGVLNLIVASLPQQLQETAYAIACEVAASDLHLEQEELRLLEMIRHKLEIDRLSAAAIERGVRALHMRE
jgi:tellurite resistance protein